MLQNRKTLPDLCSVSLECTFSREQGKLLIRHFELCRLERSLLDDITAILELSLPPVIECISPELILVHFLIDEELYLVLHVEQLGLELVHLFFVLRPPYKLSLQVYLLIELAYLLIPQPVLLLLDLLGAITPHNLGHFDISAVQVTQDTDHVTKHLPLIYWILIFLILLIRAEPVIYGHPRLTSPDLKLDVFCIYG
jgi:hypothetical protein